MELQYRGTFTDGEEFETTYDSEPFVRDVARLVPGLQEGLATMHEGGHRVLIIPAELAFGSVGIPGHIPPNATLIFELELLELKAPGSASRFDDPSD